jgi:hypothetical protein
MFAMPQTMQAVTQERYGNADALDVGNFMTGSALLDAAARFGLPTTPIWWKTTSATPSKSLIRTLLFDGCPACTSSMLATNIRRRHEHLERGPARRVARRNGCGNPGAA